MIRILSKLNHFRCGDKVMVGYLDAFEEIYNHLEAIQFKMKKIFECHTPGIIWRQKTIRLRGVLLMRCKQMEEL